MDIPDPTKNMPDPLGDYRSRPLRALGPKYQPQKSGNEGDEGRSLSGASPMLRGRLSPYDFADLRI
ncbi:hypothetical protein AGR4B_pAt10047 [Agrobacterium tumefaciens str. CFBP 5621]|nr:hypothetical protein AGR4B_pAt10047 [Agrobacterium tumefaciens str. CFBP 5621]